jgi:hypothetical protein
MLVLVNETTTDGFGVPLEAVTDVALSETPGLELLVDTVAILTLKPLGKPLNVRRMSVPFGNGVVLVDACTEVLHADAKPSARTMVASESAKPPPPWFENTRNAPLFVPVTALWVRVAIPSPNELMIGRVVDAGGM